MRAYNHDLVVPDSTGLCSTLDAIVEGGDKTLTWAGYFCWKNPLDLMIYQEIVHEVRPTVVIETGTHAGGSALFWLDMMRLADTGGVVLSADPYPHPPLPTDPGLTFVEASSTSVAFLAIVAATVKDDDVVLVNLDSDHSFDHVGQELAHLAGYVTPGSYVIVEDGVDDFRDSRRGPYAASRAFLETHPDFSRDTFRERLGLTNCPSGFLRRGRAVHSPNQNPVV